MIDAGAVDVEPTTSRSRWRRPIARLATAVLMALVATVGLPVAFGSPVGGDVAAAATPLTVDTTVDDPARSACTAAPDDCSLRGATINANADGIAEIEVIVVPAGTYTLSVAGLEAGGGSLDLNYSATLQGAGSGSTIIDANGIDRALVVNRGSGTLAERVVTVSGLTIRNGNSCSSTGHSGTGGNTSGGGIFIHGHATVSDVVIEDSDAAPCSRGGA